MFRNPKEQKAEHVPFYKVTVGQEYMYTIHRLWMVARWTTEAAFQYRSDWNGQKTFLINALLHFHPCIYCIWTLRTWLKSITEKSCVKILQIINKVCGIERERNVKPRMFFLKTFEFLKRKLRLLYPHYRAMPCTFQNGSELQSTKLGIGRKELQLLWSANAIPDN